MKQLLPFKLGEETYALNLLEVQEVVEKRSIYPLPGAPEAVTGAISFHGRIVPVVDLPQLLGFPVGPRTARLVVLTDANGPLALTVDRLRPVLNVELACATLTQSDSEADCISGVLSWQEEMISLLDLKQLQKMLEQLCSKAGG
jgi:purine-binding chemotaxis protein CheW